MMNDEQKQTKVYANAAEEIAAIELSIKRAQLADLELQKQERELSIQEKRGTIGDRLNKQKQKEMDRTQQGKVFSAQKREDEAKWAACTHKKGGVVSQRNLQVLSTGGNSPQYAVIKHQMINGDFWVRCLRCGRTWLPPVKENFYFNAKGKQVAPVDGVFSQEKFVQAENEYRQAVQFETNNTPSGSVICKFSKWDEKSEQWVDATNDYRQAVKNTNLR
jgi:hypothetical protein